MKRLFLILFCALLLTGCDSSEIIDEALELRGAILQAEACSFTAVVTADYGDKIYTFTLACVSDHNGNATFTVKAPETIAGITGQITESGGNLTFDDKILAIPMLTDDQITPISAPWILMRTLRGGYITSCSDGRMTIDDSYADDALTLDITLDAQKLPQLAEIYWKGRRILTVEVENFRLS